MTMTSSEKRNRDMRVTHHLRKAKLRRMGVAHLNM